MDWSDHAMWWPEKNAWLNKTRWTLDQYNITADAILHFTPMHKMLRVQLPDLRYMDCRLDFSQRTFNAVAALCANLGRHVQVVEVVVLKGGREARGVAQKQIIDRSPAAAAAVRWLAPSGTLLMLGSCVSARISAKSAKRPFCHFVRHSFELEREASWARSMLSFSLQEQ
jgi:hypothetical protein